MQKEKLIEKIKTLPPRNDVTLSEMDRFLGFFGFVFDRMSDSSHYLYKHRTSNKVIVFACPHSGDRHIKPSYVRNIINIINSLDAEEIE